MFILSPLCSGLKVALQMARQGLPGEPPSAQNEWGKLAGRPLSTPHAGVRHRATKAGRPGMLS